MNAPSDCVTEVTLHSSLPVDELYQRLHHHLPTSPYTQGAIYSPIRDALQVPYQQGPSAVPNTNSTEPPPTALILLLRGDFKWRFGGELEQSSSPPWSWMSEELCGKPYPYIARDFNSLYSSMVDTTSTPRFPASYTIRLNLCSPVAFDYLQTTQLRALGGWLSEESFSCSESRQSTFVTNALPYVYTQNFDATVDLRRATSLVTESLNMMKLHKPDLQWHMEAYRLEGSLQLHRVPYEFIELPSIGQVQNSTLKPALHRSPSDPLLLRKRALSNSFHSPRVKTISPSPSISPTVLFRKRKSSPDSHD